MFGQSKFLMFHIGDILELKTSILKSLWFRTELNKYLSKSKTWKVRVVYIGNTGVTVKLIGDDFKDRVIPISYDVF